MYKTPKYKRTSMRVNNSTEGETLEMKIERIVNNKEPISDGAPIIYTERKDGVQPGYDIRTDRFDVAIEAMDKVTKTHRGKREERIKTALGNDEKEGGDGGNTKSTQGTE